MKVKNKKSNTVKTDSFIEKQAINKTDNLCTEIQLLANNTTNENTYTHKHPVAENG